MLPGSAAPGIVGRYGEAWKVRVAAAAERGRANDAVVALLADTLELPRRSVALVSGHTVRDKVVQLDGISADETDRRLAAAERKD